MHDKLLNEYRANRRKGCSPRIAISKARKAILEGQTTPIGYSHCYGRSEITRQPLRPSYAFVEDMAANGFRFYKHCDELARIGIKHTGWYVDEHQEEKYRGGVWLLPARNGKSIFIAGYVDPHNEGAAFIELTPIIDDEIQAAYRADSIAEREAENEREYQEVSSAHFRYNELADEIKTERRDLLDLLCELKVLRSGLPPMKENAICKALRKQVANARYAIRTLQEQRAKILSDYGHSKLWECVS